MTTGHVETWEFLTEEPMPCRLTCPYLCSSDHRARDGQVGDGGDRAGDVRGHRGRVRLELMCMFFATYVSISQFIVVYCWYV